MPGLTHCFITGALKSGTTWIGWLLGSHPQIRIRGEGGLVGPEGGIPACLNDLMLGGWLSRPGPQRLLAGQDAERIRARLARAMIDEMLRMTCDPDERTRVVGDRAPQQYCLAPETLHRVDPDARFIDVVRDGRDVVVSNTFQNLRLRKWKYLYESDEIAERTRRYHIDGEGDPVPLLGPGCITHFATRWRLCVEGGQRAAALFGNYYRQVRYERLLDDTPGVTHDLLAWLGVNDTPDAIAHCVEAASFEARSGGREPGEDDADSFVRKGVAGEWRSYFTDDDRERFDRIAGATLSGLGYAES